MLNKFLRRIQRYILPIKIVTLLFSFTCLSYLIFQIPPTVLSITAFGLLLFLFLSLLLSFFLSMGKALLISLAISFILFLRAVDLLTTINLVLFVIFLGLLILYFRPRRVIK